MECNIEIKIETLEWMIKSFKKQPNAGIQFNHPDFSLHFILNEDIGDAQYGLSYHKTGSEILGK